MYYGKLLEIAETDNLFTLPVHPYTRSLLSSIPTLEEGYSLPQSMELEMGLDVKIDLVNPPKGCRFYDRCMMREEACKQQISMTEIKKNHLVLCRRADEIANS